MAPVNHLVIALIDVVVVILTVSRKRKMKFLKIASASAAPLARVRSVSPADVSELIRPYLGKGPRPWSRSIDMETGRPPAPSLRLPAARPVSYFSPTHHASRRHVAKNDRSRVYRGDLGAVRAWGSGCRRRGSGPLNTVGCPNSIQAPSSFTAGFCGLRDVLLPGGSLSLLFFLFLPSVRLRRAGK